TNPDGVADHLRVAVGLARVVDEPGHVAADACITGIQAVQFEAPDMPRLEVALLALQALAIGNLLACIVDNACVFRNWLSGEDAPPLNFRPSLLNHRCVIGSHHYTTARLDITRLPRSLCNLWVHPNRLRA